VQPACISPCKPITNREQFASIGSLIQCYVEGPVDLLPTWKGDSSTLDHPSCQEDNGCAWLGRIVLPLAARPDVFLSRG